MSLKVMLAAAAVVGLGVAGLGSFSASVRAMEEGDSPVSAPVPACVSGQSLDVKTNTCVAADSIGMAAYGMDSHNIRRIVVDGRVMNEGDVQAGGFLPYPVSYRSIIPAKGECENLLVPYCLSASHIGFGSIRMEPVFMVLGQSAAVAASLALDGKIPLQDVPYAALRQELDACGQILSRPVKTSAFKVGETEAEPVAAHKH